jgi:hypothetical protein
MTSDDTGDAQLLPPASTRAASYGEVVSDADEQTGSDSDEPATDPATEPSRRALSAVPPLPGVSPAAAAYAGTRPTPYGSAPYAGAVDAVPPPARRIFEMADLWTAVLGTVAVVVVGVVAGLIWYAVAPRAAAVRNTTTFGTVDPYTKAFVRDDIVFLVITVIAGLLCGVVAMLIARHRGVAVAIAMALGGFIAAYLAAWLGRYITGGPALHWADHTSVGKHPYFIALTDRQFLLGWPLAALLVTFVTALILPAQAPPSAPAPRWPVEL